jgi:hypothetical protein
MTPERRVLVRPSAAGGPAPRCEWRRDRHAHPRGQTTSGSFTVTGIGGFVGYGSAAAQGLPPNLFGGQAQLRVSLDNGSSGVLTVTCELGSRPAGHSEGIAVILGPGGAFTQEVSGNTVFIHS